MKKEKTKMNVEVKKDENKADVAPTDKTEMVRNDQFGMTHPFTLMRHFAEDMEAMLSDFGFSGRGFPEFNLMERFPRFGEFETDDFFGRREFANWAPDIEMLAQDGNLVIRADLPGIDKDDIDVEIKENRLTIKGERKKEFEEEKDGVYRSERSYGSFRRTLPLPESVNTDEAKAIFKNGVLEVTLAAPQLETTGKRLEITEAGTQTKTAASGS